MNCDSCGVKVSSKGYLGGGIVCNTCARANRESDTATIEERKEKYSND